MPFLLIDIRYQWKDADATKVVPGHPQAVYDYKGTVYCCCPATGKERTMAYRGFERDRETLKYACPAQHYGYSCEGAARCPMARGRYLQNRDQKKGLRSLVQKVA